ncbi:MAG: hypothetical protein IKY90_07360 [Oscillospiraceae bacterium]|nr:hypothetical protein [Oscillospiraceae bacterium]
MKTPEEIKKGLYHCGTIDVSCTNCPYDEDCHTQGDGYCSVEDDALIYIQQLETRLAQVERERDAAVRDLAKAMSLDGVEDCSFCKNIKKPYCDPCKWEWRGVCKENTKGD